MLSCPACGSLVHAERLKALAAAAEAAKAGGDVKAESAAWQQALDLLPDTSQQHATINARVADIMRQLAGTGQSTTATKAPTRWYKQGGAWAGALLILALTK